MEAAGIDKGILVQTSFYGNDNRYQLDSMRRYPGRFAVIGIVDPESDCVEAEIEELVGQGASGFRLAPLLRPDIHWYSERLWRVADQLGLILTLLVSPEQAVASAEAIVRHPGVKAVVDHLAHPELEHDPQHPLFERLLAMAEYDNVYVKASALDAISRQPYPHRDVLDLVRRTLDAFGPERVMWGTDYAMSSRHRYTMADVLALIDRALDGAPPEEAALVKGGTAARLWNLE